MPYRGASRIISIGGMLYLGRGGEGSGGGAFKLYRSTDHGRHWADPGVQFDSAADPNTDGVLCPTFLQFGRDCAGTRDRYVYSYEPETRDRSGRNAGSPGRSR